MRMVVNGIEVPVTKKQSKICTSMSNRRTVMWRCLPRSI